MHLRVLRWNGPFRRDDGRSGDDDDGEANEVGVRERAQHADATGLAERPRDGARLAGQERHGAALGLDAQSLAHGIDRVGVGERTFVAEERDRDAQRIEFLGHHRRMTAIGHEQLARDRAHGRGEVLELAEVADRADLPRHRCDAVLQEMASTHWVGRLAGERWALLCHPNLVKISALYRLFATSPAALSTLVGQQSVSAALMRLEGALEDNLALTLHDVLGAAR